MWMDPAMRRRGLMGSLLLEEVAPAIELAARKMQGDVHIRASDATVDILAKCCSVRVSHGFSPSNSRPKRPGLK